MSIQNIWKRFAFLPEEIITKIGLKSYYELDLYVQNLLFGGIDGAVYVVA